MKLLILGHDGRTHAIIWKLLQSPERLELVCAPGNGGTAPLTVTAAIDADDIASIGRFAFDEQFDMVLPTSTDQVHRGLVEEILSLQIAVCASSSRAAALERSRCATKEFLLRHGLPTAPGRAFTNLETAERYLATLPLPLMIKADHPAAGEARFDDRYAALEGLRRLFAARTLDGAGDGVVIESWLAGPRFVQSALSDGVTARSLPAVRLYDRLEADESGPQTAPIGAHSSNSPFAQQLTRFLHERALQPLVAALAADGLPAWGFVGVDTVIGGEGPRLTAIRFALREGEAQAVLVRLDDDLLPYLKAALTRRLAELPPPRIAPDASVAIGLFARGFPVSFPYGGAPRGFERLPDAVRVFHSATEHPDVVLPYTPRAVPGGFGAALSGLVVTPRSGGLRTTGGVPLVAAARAATLAAARERALAGADAMQFDGRAYRADIGASEM